eukprot:TRINITY_DN42725_c0_g1_i1.p1 TRINITY_DN42725_c0_g1~~TRINITY_DN42725_c0_g1_i1.p1  ORF type:complete len:345 (+),score=50.47 TRINITY_DN42725_c0_g1_i1:92-1126(+)
MPRPCPPMVLPFPQDLATPTAAPSLLRREESSGLSLRRMRCEPVKPPAAFSDEGAPPPHPISPSNPGSKNRTKIPSTDSGLARQLQEEYTIEVEKKEAKERFTCQICFAEMKLDRGVNLDCGHVTCVECFGGYLGVKIREKCVTEQELICPMPKCGCPVTEFQVQGAVERKLWDRFLASRAELYKPDAKDETRIACPCGETFIVCGAPPHSSFVKCPGCKEQVCLKCQERHVGVSCADYWRRRKENDTSQRLFDELAAQQGWRKCPECQAPCEKTSGCNYMTCASSKCRGYTKFCYICGEQLNMVEHITHFPDGLFKDACANKRLEGTDPDADFWVNLGRMFRG